MKAKKKDLRRGPDRIDIIYDNIIASNQLIKLNWSIVIATSIIIRFSCLVVMRCICIAIPPIVIEDDLHGITPLVILGR